MQLFLSVLFLSMLFVSCKELPTPTEKTYMDTLLVKIKANEKALNIDEQTLIYRKAIIRNEWLPAIKDTSSDIRGRIEDDFKGMLSAYDYYLDRHLLYVSNNRLLMEEWEEFNNECNEDKITRVEFKERYRLLNEKIDESAKLIEVIAKPVYQIEPMWMRYELVMRTNKKSHP